MIDNLSDFIASSLYIDVETYSTVNGDLSEIGAYKYSLHAEISVCGVYIGRNTINLYVAEKFLERGEYPLVLGKELSQYFKFFSLYKANACVSIRPLAQLNDDLIKLIDLHEDLDNPCLFKAYNASFESYILLPKIGDIKLNLEDIMPKIRRLQWGSSLDSALKFTNSDYKLKINKKLFTEDGLESMSKDELFHLLLYNCKDVCLLKNLTTDYELDTIHSPLLLKFLDTHPVESATRKANSKGVKIDLTKLNSYIEDSDIFIRETNLSVQKITKFLSGSAINLSQHIAMGRLLLELVKKFTEGFYPVISSRLQFTSTNNLATDRASLKIIEVLLEEVVKENLLEKEVTENPEFLALGELLALLIEGSDTVAYKLKAIRNYLVDDRVRDYISAWGTATGRWAGRGIQIQNWPKFSKLSSKNPLTHISNGLRSLIIPDRDKFIIVDFKNIELRICALISNSTKLLELFDGKKDIYQVIGDKIYLGMYDKEKARKLGKITLISCIYGAGSRKISQIHNMIFSDAEQIVANFKAMFPEVTACWDLSNDFYKSRLVYEHSGNFIRLLGFGDEGLVNYPILKSQSKEWIDNIDSFLKSLLAEGYTDFKSKKPIKLYGAKIFNNIVQALASKVLRDTFLSLSESTIDMSIPFTVHDELVIDCYSKDIDKISGLLEGIEFSFEEHSISLPMDMKIEDHYV